MPRMLLQASQKVNSAPLSMDTSESKADMAGLEVKLARFMACMAL